MATFGERLKEALDERKISAAELSRKTGISEGMISQYKSGAYVAKQKNLELFAKALDVSIPWLMGQDVAMERTEFTLNSNAELTNNGIIGQMNGNFYTDGVSNRTLTVQEQDMLRIYHESDGKTQMRIMNFIYSVEEKNKEKSGE